MEFANQLFSMLDDDARARLVYKPSKGLTGRMMKRVAPLADNPKEKGRFSDIEFVVGPEGVIFYGLRYVFGSLSTYFEEQLYGNGGCSRLELPDVSEEVFQCIYNVAYGLDPLITLDNALEVLAAAQRMGVDFLAGEVLGLLAKNIDGNNVLDVFNAAIEKEILTLPFERRCCKVILKHGKKCLESEGFLSICTELMVKLVECDFFFVNEVELWQRLVLWAKTKAAMDIESNQGGTPMGDEDEFNVGEKVVLVNGNVGTIQYKGEVDFGPGIWFGIDLRDAEGDTSGTVDGREYFTATRENGAVFVRSFRLGVKVIEKPETEEEVRVPCACGGDLKKGTAAEANGGSAVKCTVCGTPLGKEEMVTFVCPRGRVKAHDGGFYMCEECYGNKKAAEEKENESVLPTSRDVQYLRQVIPFVRFPIMPLDFFIRKVAPLLPRAMSDSVLMRKVVSTRECMFPTQERMDWNASGGDGIEFTVIAASCEDGKATSIPQEGASSQWSGQTMTSQNMRQWFIMDTEVTANVTSLDMKNHYDDGDTIKDVTIYALKNDVEWSDEEKESDNWIEQCSFESAKVKTMQQNIALRTTGNFRYWKFVVTSVWGGEGNYCCLNYLKLNGTKDEVEEDDDDNLEPRVLPATYSVVAANQSFPKAKNLYTSTNAEWSGIKMDAAGGPQFFIFDLGSPASIGTLEMVHRYSDNDTIKDIEIYRYPVGMELTEEAKTQDEGGPWVKACDLLSAQTTNVQKLDLPIPSTMTARFWKFRVVSLYGGGPTCGNYPCMNNMIVHIKMPMWTTGFCEEDM